MRRAAQTVSGALRKRALSFQSANGTVEYGPLRFWNRYPGQDIVAIVGIRILWRPRRIEIPTSERTRMRL